MKVGTDGVLLGAWCSLPKEGRVLDVGTGTGLIALMTAQRGPSLLVTGIDIDAMAVGQARENVEASPFAERVSIIASSLQEFVEHAELHDIFDAIVCNPPFFEERLLPPDTARSAARHTDTLPFPTLIADSDMLLAQGGTFSVILPTTIFDFFRDLCIVQGWSLVRLCRVRTTPSKAPKRTLATFSKGPSELPQEEEIILQEGSQRSTQYASLTKDFYL